MQTAKHIHIIMPVKDSIIMTEKAIRAIVASGHTLCVYDDHSLPENAHRLDELATELGIQVVHISDITDHPSPNYRMVLQKAQQHAMADNKHLVIVESDVIVQSDTLNKMQAEVQAGVGMVAAVTVDEQGTYNFPYHYARGWRYRLCGQKTIATKKRFSFCCTLLTNELLHKADFQLLDPTKNWYDVTISHWSVHLGLINLLMLGNPVLHFPHASRPWKRLKYTHPLRYYWRKFTQKLDKI
ncbi:MAG: glycosyltransferase family 2 protein [Paludibacteraceae bacterium]|nr:glycosyltransferase family 2 protein [Paludibacteraceae bacterium]